ncbi:DegT/DnrJ/EryC1/StrS family aminotransferase [Streptomyces sp. NPDC002913]
MSVATAVGGGRAEPLAVDGGTPVRHHSRAWPRWPVPAAGAEHLLNEVLHRGRWAISGPGEGELFERRFAARFAEYTGARHCVPTDHGSSALVIALESLGLEQGAPVAVPALTWVACATAVFRAGLVPVLVDVDEHTGCLTPQTLPMDVFPAAILAVHWACAMADVPALTEFAEPRGAVVVEDAAQAPGALWQGRRAGSLGRLGCFSMHHAKALTCGEGGAVVTDDPVLAMRLEELRADSRRYRPESRPGMLDLTETASVMGSNFCLNEFGAALACAQLDVLDEQHTVRNRNYALLATLLAGTPEVRLLRHAPQQDGLALYEVPVVFDGLPRGTDIASVAEALTAELGFPVYPPRAPLHRSSLLRPGSKAALAPLAERFEVLHRDRSYPVAEYLSTHAVLLHHRAFLGTEEDMADLASAVAKVTAALRTRGQRRASDGRN